MKKSLINLIFILFLSFFMTSCYTYTYTVGNGPQSGAEIVEKNHYLVYGLAAIKTSDPTVMAGDAKDYEVTITHSFIDGLINGLTFGIYNPTTTIVNQY